MFLNEGKCRIKQTDELKYEGENVLASRAAGLCMNKRRKLCRSACWEQPNSCFVCRSLGVHCSKVRSLTLDSWEPELLKVRAKASSS